MNDVAVKVIEVSKTFKLPHEKHSSLKSTFINFRKRGYELQKALDKVSFEVKKGEFFGIVGRNGSGKSTLLNMIAGIYAPTKGEIKVNGSLTPFIELGVGFNSELSGRENIFLNGALLGFSRKQMQAMYKDIVEFAELDKFMDQKLKNYSSGMQVRLAFSIAIRAQGNILILDEVLAVGDAAFQKKCNDYFYDLKEQKQTVILVTHSMGNVEQYCDRAMLIDSGKVIKIGNPTETADAYNEFNLRTSIANLEEKNKKSDISSGSDKDKKLHGGRITKVETYNPDTKQRQNTFTSSERIGVKYFIETYSKLESPTIGLVFKDREDNQVFATNTPSMQIKLRDLEPRQKIRVEFDVDNIFGNGNYFISGALASRDRSEVYHRITSIHAFEVGGWKFPPSTAHPQHDIKIIYR